jgi:hypothetical protein
MSPLGEKPIMAVKDEFPEDNFVRATRHINTARVVAHLLTSNMRELFPRIVVEEVTISAVENQGWCNLTFWVSSSLATSSELPYHWRSSQSKTTSLPIPLKMGRLMSLML